MSRGRKFAVTVWNTNDKPDDKYPGLRYLVYQKEKCPETGKEHYQLYCEFEKTVRYACVKKMVNDDTAHIEIPKGDAASNKKYCTKEESRIDGPWEFGKPVKQGQRTDLEELAEQVVDIKKPFVDTMLDNPTMTIRYPRGMQTLRTAALTKAGMQQRDVEVIVIIGDPGSGKTRTIWDSHKPEEIYSLTCTTQSVWFDHYDGQKVLLIDDYKGWIPYTFLLNMLDRYPLKVPVKGSHVAALWTKVYITSNYEIETWYAPGFNMEALHRRIKEVQYKD